MKFNKTYTYHGYSMIPFSKEYASAYYEAGFKQVDTEIIKLTGSQASYDKDSVQQYFVDCIYDESRYDFLIMNEQNQIIGESVINEIDFETRTANFRIALFSKTQCGKGIGSWAVSKTVEFSFEEISLHRLELDVFSINERAIKAYEKAGFVYEGRRREAIFIDGTYYDDIFMSILESEYQKKKCRI